MPSDAPKVKARRPPATAPEIKFYDRLTESREKIAARIAAERGAVVGAGLRRPAHHRRPGHAGLELMRQAQARGVTPGVVITPVQRWRPALGRGHRGEGDLAEDRPDRRRARRLRRHAEVPAGRRAHADDADPPHPVRRAGDARVPGELTFPILKRTVADIAVVTDAEVAEAMRYAFSTLKLVVEPGGSAGLAALLAGKVKTFGSEAIALVLSGGNVDPSSSPRCCAASSSRSAEHLDRGRGAQRAVDVGPGPKKTYPGDAADQISIRAQRRHGAGVQRPLSAVGSVCRVCLSCCSGMLAAEQRDRRPTISA
jgi:threonine dehydratase